MNIATVPGPSPARADIDLEAPGKRVGHVRLPHSTHESAYGWIRSRSR